MLNETWKSYCVLKRPMDKETVNSQQNMMNILILINFTQFCKQGCPTLFFDGGKTRVLKVCGGWFDLSRKGRSKSLRKEKKSIENSAHYIHKVL